MQKSNPSNIKIQMNNFTLNLQTLLSKDLQQLPTTHRKPNQTQRRTNSNFQDISPLKVKKKTKEKDYATAKNKTKKYDLFDNLRPGSKPSKVVKDKKQPDTSKKHKKTQQKTTQAHSKNKKQKSTRLQRHFADYDYVIQSARLRTSPSQNYHHNFNSESISKSASRSRSKSYKKVLNEKDKNKSRSKSIFDSSQNDRFNTQRSTSKIKSKKADKMQKTQNQQKSSQKPLKKLRSSKSRQRKSIDNYKKKSKSRQRIYTQISERLTLDDKHFNSDFVNHNEEKVFMSHKKSKSKFEKFTDNMMSNSSEMGSMGPKFISNKASSKEKLREKSEKKKKSKKVSGTASSTVLQKPSQNEKQKQKKQNLQKKLSTKVSRKQTMKKKSTLDSQFNFYQSINVQKKKLTEQDLNETEQRKTAKKGKIKKMKTQTGQMPQQNNELSEFSGFKINKREKEDEGWTIEKAFKKKNNGIDVVDRLFNEKNLILKDYMQKYTFEQSNSNSMNSGSVKERLKISNEQESSVSPMTTVSPMRVVPQITTEQMMPGGNKLRQFPQIKKLTIMTDFNPIDNKEIYFDDISKILLKKINRAEQEEKEVRDSISRTQKSIRDEVMDSKRGSLSLEWNEEKEMNSSRQSEYDNDFQYVLHKRKQPNEYEAACLQKARNSQQRQSRIQKISQQDLAESSSQSQLKSHHESHEASLQSHNQESSHELDQLEELNNHLEKLIKEDYSRKSSTINDHAVGSFKQGESSSLSSQNLSITEQPLFGKSSPIHRKEDKTHSKSLTVIQAAKRNNSLNSDINESNPIYTKQVLLKTNKKQGDPSIKSQKKCISSTFLRSTSEKVSQGRTPLCSPSSYAMQNKQKVISSLLHKPRKSIEQQCLIAKTLSNKRLLEELELLDTLEKIEKSVENSLIYQGSHVRNYFGVEGKQEDNIVEEKHNFLEKDTNNYQSQRGQKKEEIQITDNLVLIDNSEQESEIYKLEDELLLKVSTIGIKAVHKLAQIKGDNQMLDKSPETLLLQTVDRLKSQQKQDSPLLSNHSSESKRPHIQQFKSQTSEIAQKQQSAQEQKQFKRSPMVSSLINQLKVKPFQHTYEEIQDFFSNNSCISNNKDDENQIKLFLNGCTPNNARPENNHRNMLANGAEPQVEEEESVFEVKEDSSLRKKTDFSELTLEFEKEMDDYLKDHEQTSVKNKIMQIKANALKANPTNHQNYENKNLSKSQQESLQKSDEFYHKSKISISPLSQQELSNNELIKNQLATFVENKLLNEFCEHLSKHKEMLHSFLYFISKCDLIVFENNQQKQAQEKEQREVNEEKFMEYLQSRIFYKNEFVSGLGADVLAFIKRSEEYQSIFIRNINRPFGIIPLKTLKWMRKVYADEENKKQSRQEHDNHLDNSQQHQDQEESQNMSGLSDCSEVQAIFPPELLADFDAYQSENIIEQINQQQFYLNHSLYAALNQICDRFRPFGENGYPVIAKQRPTYTQSIEQVENKIMKRLNYILSQKWGRIQFLSDEEPEKAINDTYRRMDDDIRREDDERWSERNMDDTVFENVYFLSKHIVDLIINQEVMEIYRMIDS